MPYFALEPYKVSFSCLFRIFFGLEINLLEPPEQMIIGKYITHDRKPTDKATAAYPFAIPNVHG
jgi:hypothetical protein